jgi:hypothetical protein
MEEVNDWEDRYADSIILTGKYKQHPVPYVNTGLDWLSIIMRQESDPGQFYCQGYINIKPQFVIL